MHRNAQLLHRFYAHPAAVHSIIQPPAEMYERLMAGRANQQSPSSSTASSVKRKLFVRTPSQSQDSSRSSLQSAESIDLDFDDHEGNLLLLANRLPVERLLAFMFSIGADNSITLLNLEELTAPITLGAHPSAVVALEFNADATLSVRCHGEGCDPSAAECPTLLTWSFGVGMAQLESQSVADSRPADLASVVCAM